MTARGTPLRIGRVDIQDAEQAMVRTGRQTAAPARFTAQIEVKTPKMRVTLRLHLEDGTVPRVECLAIWPGQQPITSTLLRKVSPDQLVTAALAAASRKVADRGDVMPGAFQVDGEQGSNEVHVNAPPGTDERVLRAARLYRNAVNSGSRSPGKATAEGMDLSREHAARYIRRARAAGLLPPVEDVVKDRARSQPRAVSEPRNPPGWTPMRRLRDLGNPETWAPDDDTPPDRQAAPRD